MAWLVRSFALTTSIVTLFAGVLATPCSATPAVQWRELRVPARGANVIVWDSRRERALMLGGDSRNGLPYASVWRYLPSPRAHWEQLQTAGGGPLKRNGIAAVYDSSRDRVLVFGGGDGGATSGSNDVWALSLGEMPTWSLLDVSAAGRPVARAWVSLILDPSRDRLVMYGSGGQASSDSSVWVLPLSPPLAWSRLDLVPSPGPRIRHGAVYSPVTDRMTIFGGERRVVGGSGVVSTPLFPAATWELSFEEPMRWVMRASAPNDTVPLPASGGSLVADRAGESALWFPGDERVSASLRDATIWRLDLLASTWTRVQDGGGGPGLVVSPGTVRLPGSGGVLIHGGANSVLLGNVSGTRTATWNFDVAIPLWTQTVLLPPLGSSLYAVLTCFDAAERKLIRRTAAGIWTCDLGLDAAWELDPAGGVDPPTASAITVLDTRRHRLIAFGGQASTGESLVPTTLWSWPLDGPGPWTAVAIEGRPPLGTWGTQFAYDSVLDRVVVLPSLGRNEPASIAMLDSVSVLELGGSAPLWQRVAVAGSPPPSRYGASVVVDVARDRLILQGGGDYDLIGTAKRDLWTLSLASPLQWTMAIPYTTPPSFGFYHGLAIDPTLDRLLVFGGTGTGPQDIGDKRLVVASSLDPLTSWTDLDPDASSPMLAPGFAMYDAAAERALFWNGTLWEITWPHGAVSVEGGAGSPGLSLTPVRPNPATDRVAFDVATDRDSEVAIDVFDTAGRRMVPTHHRQVKAGRTPVEWLVPTPLAPGVYLLRARSGSRTTIARFAVAR